MWCGVEVHEGGKKRRLVPVTYAGQKGLADHAPRSALHLRLEVLEKQLMGGQQLVDVREDEVRVRLEGCSW